MVLPVLPSLVAANPTKYGLNQTAPTSGYLRQTRPVTIPWLLAFTQSSTPSMVQPPLWLVPLVHAPLLPLHLHQPALHQQVPKHSSLQLEPIVETVQL